MADAYLMTPEKFKELQEELEYLRLKKMPEIARRIDDARQLGDLSENAEYHAAREEMAWTQSRLRELNTIVDNAEMITQKEGGTLTVGSTLVAEVNGKERELKIVGAQEAEPAAGKISNESPLGKALMGHKKGDKVEVQVPSGTQIYKILQVK